MAKRKYNEIYMALREKMEDGTYGFQELLPLGKYPGKGV